MKQLQQRFAGFIFHPFSVVLIQLNFCLILHTRFLSSLLTFLCFFGLLLKEVIRIHTILYCRGPAWGTPPWQRSWGRRLGIRKGVIKPQETPCSWAPNPKPESVLCSHLHLWLYGGLSPITVSLGEGVNVQLQGNKNSWAWQECFSLRTPLKVI